MKPYIIALVILCSLSLAAPVMAADLTATQISSTEVWVNGTGFNPGEVTLLTETNIPVTPSGDDYLYELTGIVLPAGAVLELDASPVNNDLELYLKKNWLMVWTFDKSDGSTIGYRYDSSTGTVHVAGRVPFKLKFQTIRISGTTAHSSVDLNVAVKQDVTADGGGSFSELVDISAIPAGDYRIHAADGANTATVQTAISAPGDLHSITITDPETGNLTLGTNGSYTFGATGYDYLGAVVPGVAFTWTSSNTSVGTISSSTGDFEADNAGTTEVYARNGTKESNPITVSVIPEPTIQEGSYNFTESTNTTGVYNVTINETGRITVIGDGNLTETVVIDLGAGTRLVLDIDVDEDDPTNGTVNSIVFDTPDVPVNELLDGSVDIDLNLNDSALNGSQTIGLTIQPLNDLNYTAAGWNGTALGANATANVTIMMDSIGLSGVDVSVVVHASLSGINESDVDSLPINMTVNGAWYRDVAGSKVANVYLSKFDDNGTRKDWKNPIGNPTYNKTADTYKFCFVMEGFSTFVLVGGKSAPSGGGTYPPEPEPTGQEGSYNFTESTNTTGGYNVTINETGHITGDDNLTETVEIDLGPGNGTMKLNVTIDSSNPNNGTVDYGIWADIGNPVEHPSLKWSSDIGMKLNESACSNNSLRIKRYAHNTIKDAIGWSPHDADNATAAMGSVMAGFSGGFNVKAVQTLKLVEGDPSGVLSLLLNMTVDKAWFRDEAASDPDNVFLLKFYTNGTVKEHEEPIGDPAYDPANDTYTFHFEMPGFSTFALVGGNSAPLIQSDSDISSGSGTYPSTQSDSDSSSGSGTYPPGWFGTPTVTATAVTTVTPPEEAVTPPTKPAVAEETPSVVAEETPTKQKKWIPGFTAVFAIAGLLAVAYVMMRRRE